MSSSYSITPGGIRPGSGRKLDPIRSCFEEIFIGSKLNGMRCLDCKVIVSPKTCRLKNHKEKCLKSQKVPALAQNNESTDSDVEAETCYQNHSREKISKKRKHNSIDHDSSTSCINLTQHNTTVQKKVSNFIIKTTPQEKEVLDKCIARYFFSCNVPFNHCSRHYFKEMIEKLRPGYSPPSRQIMAGDLLETITSEAYTEAKSKLTNKTVTLIQDGWSSIHNDPVISNCISDGKSTYFLNAVDTESNHKTSDYCLKLAVEAIKDAKEKFGCYVRSFVSDNENKMKKMREDLALIENEGLTNDDYGYNFFISYGCSAHYLNLVGVDIFKLPSISTTNANIVKVSKYFRNHHVAKGLLNELNGLMPQLPSETRWNSYEVCFDIFFKNREKYIFIVENHEEDIDVNIRKMITNIGVFKETKHLMELLKPLPKCLFGQTSK